jgi:hypothetical protein
MGAQRPRMDGRAVALAFVALLVAMTALIIALRNGGNAAANAPRAPQTSAPARAVVIAPDLLGMTAQQATSTATRLGLVVTTVSAEAAGFPTGTVIAMRGVATGELIHKGDQITLVVTAGP